MLALLDICVMGPPTDMGYKPNSGDDFFSLYVARVQRIQICIILGS